ncbi:hypothetical protein P3447_09225 [Vibrio parahaemolyticus]|nr:hypothetical protein [Vibrio parahaemolyticus]
MTIYEFLKPHLSKVCHHELFHGQPRITKEGDKVIYSVFNDGDICHEQNLLTGNGRYSVDHTTEVWRSDENHQIVTLHNVPTDEDAKYQMNIVSYNTKAEALEKLQVNFHYVIFAAYIAATGQFEILENELSPTDAALTNWADFAEQLLEHHPTINIGVHTELESADVHTEEEYQCI